jgi:hypothetical protein
MPEKPSNDSVQQDANTLAQAEPMDSSVESSASGDGSSLEQNQAQAITLAQFLMMRFVSLHANMIRSRWGLQASATFDGVPYSSMVQRPDG